MGGFCRSLLTGIWSFVIFCLLFCNEVQKESLCELHQCISVFHIIKHRVNASSRRMFRSDSHQNTAEKYSVTPCKMFSFEEPTPRQFRSPTMVQKCPILDSKNFLLWTAWFGTTSCHLFVSQPVILGDPVMQQQCVLFPFPDCLCSLQHHFLLSTLRFKVIWMISHCVESLVFLIIIFAAITDLPIRAHKWVECHIYMLSGR